MEDYISAAKRLMGSPRPVNHGQKTTPPREGGPPTVGVRRADRLFPEGRIRGGMTYLLPDDFPFSRKWKTAAIRRVFRRFLDSFACQVLPGLRWCHGQRPSTNAEAHPLDERVERCQVPRGTRHAGYCPARAAGVAAALGEGNVSSSLRVYTADGDVM